LWRYGKGIQRQLDQARMVVYQARALASVGGGDKDVLIMAIKTVVEQKVLTKLIEEEPLKNIDIRLMNATANLVRASVFDQRRTDHIRAHRRERKNPQQTGSLDAIDRILRDVLLGIDRSGEQHSSALSVTDEILNELEAGGHNQLGDTAPAGLARAEMPEDRSKCLGSRQTVRAKEADRIQANAGPLASEAAPAHPSEATSIESKGMTWPTLIVPGARGQSGPRPGQGPKPKVGQLRIPYYAQVRAPPRIAADRNAATAFIEIESSGQKSGNGFAVQYLTAS
jgi:hypothetical protein